MASSEYQKKQRQAELEAKEKLTDAEEDQLAGLQAQNRERERALEYTSDLTAALSKQLKYTKQQTEAFRGVVNAFSPLNEKATDLFNVVTALKDPLTAGFKLIELSVKRFVELDNAAKAFRDTTGFLSSQTKEVETNIRQSSRDLAEFGVSVDVARDSAAALATAFGDTAIVNKENLEYVSLMKQNLGISADDSVSLMQNFMGIGGMTSQVARETAGAAASLAKAAGVPLGKVMQEVAKPSDTVRSLIRGSVDGLIKGAIEAKRLGTSLESVGKAAAGLLDFQSSINDEMEASVLFGKDVNLQKARELSYAGDLKGLAKEQSRLLQEAGDVSKMDYFQRIGIAKAMGMTVEEMDKMNAKQQELNKLKIDDPATYARYTANLDTINKTNESLSEKYQKELKSQQIASQQEKIMNSINSIMTELADALLPVINTLVPIIGLLLKISVILVKFILAPFRLLNDAIDLGLQKLKPYIDILDLIEKGFQEFSNFFFNDDIGKWIGGAVGAIAIVLATLNSVSLMTLLVTAITSPFKIAAKLIPGFFKGAVGSVPQAIQQPLQNSAGKFTGLFSGAASTAASTATSAVTDAATSAIPTPGATGAGAASAAASTPAAAAPAVPSAAGAATSSIPPVPPTANKTAGQNIKEFLTNLADGIKSFKPLGEILKGLFGIAASGPAFLLFITAIPGILLMAAVGAMGPLIVGGFTALSTGIKMMDIAKIGMGVLGILALGAAFIPFTFALSLLTGVSPTAILASVAAMYALGAGAIFLGSIFASGIGAALFFAGVAGIAALGAAFIPFGKASQMAGEGMKNFGDGVKDIAANISQISSLEETFSIFKDQELIEGIYSMGFAIAFLNTQLSALGTNLPALAEINKSKNEQSANGEVVAKLDELIGLMQSGAIAVNIDGSKVSTAVGVATRFKGAS